MKTTIDTDLVIAPGEEAKICLTCEKKKCTPECSRYKREVKRISGKESRMERVHRLVEEEYEKALECRWISRKLAYAIYQVWKIIDSEGTKNEGETAERMEQLNAGGEA
jgi:hypothetical protein